MTEDALRSEICRIGQLMYQNGYIDGSSGNISARIDANRILTTASGLAKGFMSLDQLIVVNLNGERIDKITPENAHLKPTSELAMHLECYRRRSDVHGVVHAHPPVAVALTLIGYDFERCIIPEMVVLLGTIPTAPYSTPASVENRDAIHHLIRHHDTILLSHHGSLTVASTVNEAYMRLETLEHGAKILHLAEQTGRDVAILSPQQVEKLIQMRERLGLLHEGDQARILRGAKIV